MRKPKIKRYDTPFGRCYILGQGEHEKLMPSVTTVLSSIKMQYVDDLRADMGDEKFNHITQQAALRGTAMHKFLENYLICKQVKGSGEHCLLYTQKKSVDELKGTMDDDRINVGRKLFYNIYNQGLLDEIAKVIFTEKFLWSVEHLFAGTGDHGFFDSKGRIVLGDFKSGSSPRGPEQIAKFKKQLGAYSLAFKENTGRDVDRAEVWISHPNGVQVVNIERDELLHEQESFLQVLRQFHAQWDVKKIRDFVNNLRQTEELSE